MLNEKARTFTFKHRDTKYSNIEQKLIKLFLLCSIYKYQIYLVTLYTTGFNAHKSTIKQYQEQYHVSTSEIGVLNSKYFK